MGGLEPSGLRSVILASSKFLNSHLQYLHLFVFPSQCCLFGLHSALCLLEVTCQRTVTVTLGCQISFQSGYCSFQFQQLLLRGELEKKKKVYVKRWDVPLVEFTYLVFTCMPGESYSTRLRSLLLYLCDVFPALTDSLVCWLNAEFFFFYRNSYDPPTHDAFLFKKQKQFHVRKHFLFALFQCRQTCISVRCMCMQNRIPRYKMKRWEKKCGLKFTSYSQGFTGHRSAKPHSKVSLHVK